MSIYVSILQGGTNNHETTSEEANYHATDFVSEGVVGEITNTSDVAPATGAFAVNAQDTPDMSVAVSAGVAYVQATPTGGSSQTLRIHNNASADVTISSNSSGSTKYDWVYIKVDPDKAKDPNSAADDVATLVTSRSSSASSDDGTPPTYGYALAVVTVANSAVSISDSNIADVRVMTSPVPDGAVTDDKLDYPRWWPELSRTTLSGSADTITLSSIPARKYLYIIVNLLNSGALDVVMRFNNDSSSNYVYRYSANGGTDTTATNTGIFANSGSSFDLKSLFEVTNETAREKVVFGRLIAVNSAGTSNIPGRAELSGKWANTSNQITRVDLVNVGTGDFASGSEVIVLGHD